MKGSLAQRLRLPTILLAIVITAIGGVVAWRTQAQVQATAGRLAGRVGRFRLATA